MRLGIVGCRDFIDYNRLEKEVSVIRANYKISTIVSGGASGADALAKRYAKVHNLSYKEFKPDWNKYGRSAGPKRNKLIVQASDMIVAFWDYNSKGTASTIRIAKEMKKTIIIIDIRRR